MSLFGECDDCGEADHLRYKPDVPADKQTRPSICSFCRAEFGGADGRAAPWAWAGDPAARRRRR